MNLGDLFYSVGIKVTDTSELDKLEHRMRELSSLTNLNINLDKLEHRMRELSSLTNLNINLDITNTNLLKSLKIGLDEIGMAAKNTSKQYEDLHAAMLNAFKNNPTNQIKNELKGFSDLEKRGEKLRLAIEGIAKAEDKLTAARGGSSDIDKEIIRITAEATKLKEVFKAIQTQYGNLGLTDKAFSTPEKYIANIENLLSILNQVKGLGLKKSADDIKSSIEGMFKSLGNDRDVLSTFKKIQEYSARVMSAMAHIDPSKVAIEVRKAYSEWQTEISRQKGFFVGSLEIDKVYVRQVLLSDPRLLNLRKDIADALRSEPFKIDVVTNTINGKHKNVFSADNATLEEAKNRFKELGEIVFKGVDARIPKDVNERTQALASSLNAVYQVFKKFDDLGHTSLRDALSFGNATQINDAISQAESLWKFLQNPNTKDKGIIDNVIENTSNTLSKIAEAAKSAADSSKGAADSPKETPKEAAKEAADAKKEIDDVKAVSDKVKELRGKIAELESNKKAMLTSLYMGDAKKKGHDILEVANTLYKIIGKIGSPINGKEKLFSVQAEGPILALAKAYKITRDEAVKLVRSIQESDVVQKKFLMSFDDKMGLWQINMQQRKNLPKDSEFYSNQSDWQIRLDKAKQNLKLQENFEERQQELSAKKQQQADSIDRVSQAVEELGKKYNHTAEQAKKLNELIASGVLAPAEVQRKLAVGYNQAADIVKTISSIQQPQSKPVETLDQTAKSADKAADSVKTLAERAAEAYLQMQKLAEADSRVTTIPEYKKQYERNLKKVSDPTRVTETDIKVVESYLSRFSDKLGNEVPSQVDKAADAIRKLNEEITKGKVSKTAVESFKKEFSQFNGSAEYTALSKELSSIKGAAPTDALKAAFSEFAKQYDAYRATQGLSPVFKQLSTGGIVKGPGTGTSDNVPALLSNGEFVMSQKAVERLGTAFFESINKAKGDLKEILGLVAIHPTLSKDNTLRLDIEKALSNIELKGASFSEDSMQKMHAQLSQLIASLRGDIASGTSNTPAVTVRRRIGFGNENEYVASTGKGGVQDFIDGQKTMAAQASETSNQIVDAKKKEKQAQQEATETAKTAATTQISTQERTAKQVGAEIKKVNEEINSINSFLALIPNDAPARPGLLEALSKHEQRLESLKKERDALIDKANAEKRAANAAEEAQKKEKKGKDDVGKARKYSKALEDEILSLQTYAVKHNGSRISERIEELKALKKVVDEVGDSSKKAIEVLDKHGMSLQNIKADTRIAKSQQKYDDEKARQYEQAELNWRRQRQRELESVFGMNYTLAARTENSPYAGMQSTGFKDEMFDQMIAGIERAYNKLLAERDKLKAGMSDTSFMDKELDKWAEFIKTLRSFEGDLFGMLYARFLGREQMPSLRSDMTFARARDAAYSKNEKNDKDAAADSEKAAKTVKEADDKIIAERKRLQSALDKFQKDAYATVGKTSVKVDASQAIATINDLFNQLNRLSAMSGDKRLEKLNEMLRQGVFSLGRQKAGSQYGAALGKARGLAKGTEDNWKSMRAEIDRLYKEAKDEKDVNDKIIAERQRLQNALKKFQTLETRVSGQTVVRVDATEAINTVNALIQRLEYIEQLTGRQKVAEWNAAASKGEFINGRKLAGTQYSHATHDAMSSAKIIESNRRASEKAAKTEKDDLERLKKIAQEVQFEYSKLRKAQRNARGLGFDSKEINAAVNAYRKYLATIKQVLAAQSGATDLVGKHGTWKAGMKPLIENAHSANTAIQGVVGQIGLSTGAMNAQNSVLVQMASRIFSLEHQFSMLGTTIENTFSLYGLQQFLDKVIQIGGELEKQELAMGAILQDQHKASEIFEQVSELSMISPFDVQDLVKNTKLLSAFGIKYDDLYDTTRRLSDIAAALGVDFQRIAYEFGQTSARGWLDARELRMFANSGIPLLQKLSDLYSQERGEVVSTSAVRKMISNREVSFEDVRKVMWQMTDEGGNFYNMQQVMAESLAATYRNMLNAFNLMYGEIAKSEVGDVLKSIISTISDLTKHWKSFGIVIGGTVFFGAAIHKVLSSVGYVMKQNINTIISQMIAEKQLQASILTEKAQLVSLTKAEQVAIATRNKLTIADYNQLMANQALSTSAKVRLIAESNLNKTGKMMLLLSQGLTKRQIALALRIGATTGVTKAWNIAMLRASMSLNALGKMMAANWPMLMAAGLTAAVAAIYDVFRKMNELEEELDKIKKKSESEATAEIGELERIVVALKNEMNTREERNKLISALNSKFGDYLGNLVSEAATYNEIADAAERAKDAIVAKAKSDAASESIKKIYEKAREQEDSLPQRFSTVPVGEHTEAQKVIENSFGLIKDLIKENVEKGNDFTEIRKEIYKFLAENFGLEENEINKALWGQSVGRWVSYYTEIDKQVQKLVNDKYDMHPHKELVKKIDKYYTDLIGGETNENQKLRIRLMRNYAVQELFKRGKLFLGDETLYVRPADAKGKQRSEYKPLSNYYTKVAAEEIDKIEKQLGADWQNIVLEMLSDKDLIGDVIGIKSAFGIKANANELEYLKDVSNIRKKLIEEREGFEKIQEWTLGKDDKRKIQVIDTQLHWLDVLAQRLGINWKDFGSQKEDKKLTDRITNLKKAYDELKRFVLLYGQKEGINHWKQTDHYAIEFAELGINSLEGYRSALDKLHDEVERFGTTSQMLKVDELRNQFDIDFDTKKAEISISELKNKLQKEVESWKFFETLLTSGIDSDTAWNTAFKGVKEQMQKAFEDAYLGAAKKSVVDAVKKETGYTFGLKSGDLPISKGLEAFLKREEGLKLTPYNINGGETLSVGYGHNLGGKPSDLSAITPEQAEEYFRSDVIKHYNAIRSFIDQVFSKHGVGALTQNMIDALVDLAYNTGGGYIASSNLGKAILEDPKNFEKIGEAWKKFAITQKDTGNVLPGLVRRRAREFGWYSGESSDVYLETVENEIADRIENLKLDEILKMSEGEIRNMFKDNADAIVEAVGNYQSAVKDGLDKLKKESVGDYFFRMIKLILPDLTRSELEALRYLDDEGIQEYGRRNKVSLDKIQSQNLRGYVEAYFNNEEEERKAFQQGIQEALMNVDSYLKKRAGIEAKFDKLRKKANDAERDILNEEERRQINALNLERARELSQMRGDTTLATKLAEIEAERRLELSKVDKDTAKRDAINRKYDMQAEAERLKYWSETGMAKFALGNLASVSKRVVDEIMSQLKAVDINKLSKEDQEKFYEIRGKLIEASVGKGGISSIQTAINDVNTASKEVQFAKKRVEEIGSVLYGQEGLSEEERAGIEQELAEAEQQLAEAQGNQAVAIDNLKRSFEALDKRINDIAQSFNKLGDAIGGGWGEAFKAVGDLMGSFSNFRAAGAKIAQGDWTGYLDYAAELISISKKMDDLVGDLQYRMYEHEARKLQRINDMTRAVDDYAIAVENATQKEKNWFSTTKAGGIADNASLMKKTLDRYYDEALMSQKIYKDKKKGGWGAYALAGIASAVGAAVSYLSMGSATGLAAGLIASAWAAAGAVSGVAQVAAVKGIAEYLSYRSGETAAMYNLRMETRKRDKGFWGSGWGGHSQKTQGIQEWLDDVNKLVSARYSMSQSDYDKYAKQFEGSSAKKEFAKQAAALGIESFELFDEYGMVNIELAKAILENKTLSGKLVGETKDTLESLVALAEKYEEYKDAIKETISEWYSPLLQNMSEAIWKWFDTGANALLSFRDLASKTFREIASDMMQTIVLRDLFDDYKESLEQITMSWGSGSMTDEQYARQISNLTGQLNDNFAMQLPMYEKFLQTFNDALEANGFTLRDLDASSGSASSIRGITEETSEILAAYVNGIRGDVSVQRYVIEMIGYETLPQMSATATAQLAQLNQQTEYLRQLSEISNSISGDVSQIRGLLVDVTNDSKQFYVN